MEKRNKAHIAGHDKKLLNKLKLKLEKLPQPNQVIRSRAEFKPFSFELGFWGGGGGDEEGR